MQCTASLQRIATEGIQIECSFDFCVGYDESFGKRTPSEKERLEAVDTVATTIRISYFPV